MSCAVTTSLDTTSNWSVKRMQSPNPEIRACFRVFQGNSNRSKLDPDTDLTFTSRQHLGNRVERFGNNIIAVLDSGWILPI